MALLDATVSRQSSGKTLQVTGNPYLRSHIWGLVSATWANELPLLLHLQGPKDLDFYSIELIKNSPACRTCSWYR